LKRIFAIVLLGIHLFNLGGYALLYRYYIHQSDVQMVKQIFDNKISNKKLIELKVPVNMPTIQDWDEYEVIEGQIQLKDAYYNYVRLRMTRDTMYLICVPNETKTRLEKANVIAAKEINDVPLTKKGEAPISKKINALSEYDLQAFEYDYIAFSINIKQTTKPISFSLSKPYIESPGQPPNFIAW